MKPNLSMCADCGMAVSPGEYHPFAACLMFKACHDGDTVRANLDAVRGHSAQQGAAKCKCSFRIKMTGDGCRYCNAQEYIDRLHDQIEEMDKEQDVDKVDAQPEWIDDPHDIEQGMMRNPKYKAQPDPSMAGDDPAFYRDACLCAMMAIGKAGANADTKHPLRKAWELCRTALENPVNIPVDESEVSADTLGRLCAGKATSGDQLVAWRELVRLSVQPASGEDAK